MTQPPPPAQFCGRCYRCPLPGHHCPCLRFPPWILRFRYRVPACHLRAAWRFLPAWRRLGSNRLGVTSNSLGLPGTHLVLP